MFGKLRQLAKAKWSPVSAIENQDELVTSGEVGEPPRGASRIRQNKVRGDFPKAEDVGVVHLSDPVQTIDDLRYLYHSSTVLCTLLFPEGEQNGQENVEEGEEAGRDQTAEAKTKNPIKLESIEVSVPSKG